MSLETKLLHTSFSLLREHEEEFTACFYSTLFSEHPQVKPLFNATHMNEQSKKLFASLVLVVNNLTKPDILADALKSLGSKHVGYGVLPEHYPIVGTTLLKAMSMTLKDKWTAEVEEAWTQAYAVIAEIMLEGADSPKESFCFNNASAS